ncbi:hypothetical protein bpr_IV179 (plasmid) [Butyrivibrio proteoclasticus B316]|uniref:Uncharacterized protein n=1 Tax=Butyrivibrio proteoclasticus (strain ATCC 51982 / DSM 14932 / B316) TaxID=515622 RepID=E0S561_BUTPB|nr:hypothetical protein [Butyrivibrio proteoclasticus]ADL36543.1 hypothetical protein bpr_IV179 [Butyrivibrio proteoclasticus B316]
MSKILIGNWLMVIFSIFYLTWWLIVFKPPAPKGSLIGNILLICAFASGIAGLFLTIREMAVPTAEMQNRGVNGFLIIAIGIVLYLVLLAMTKIVFHRQVTSELFIITGWIVLQAAICNYMYALGVFTVKEAAIVAVVVLIAGIISLVCYILYYELPYVKGYIDGCIPLVLVMIVMIAINLMIKGKTL